MKQSVLHLIMHSLCRLTVLQLVYNILKDILAYFTYLLT